MKNHAKTLLTSSVALLLLTACGSSNQQSKSTQTDTVESSQVAEETAETVESSQTSEETTETVEFFAKGEYEVGVDIQPGSYYAVLTEMQYAERYKDESQGYVSISVKDSNEEGKYYQGIIEEVGKPYRINLDDGDIIKFSDNYDPAGWTVTFFTSEDYKEYQASEKK